MEDERMPDAEPNPAGAVPSRPPRLGELISEVVRDLFSQHFEGLFVIITLLVLGAILHFIDQKLSLLDLYFLPVLVAGVFMDARRAVLGGLLAIAWVSFFVVIDPTAFSQEMGPRGLYLHLLSWGSLLVLTGAIVGRMAERLQERYRSAAAALAETARLKADLDKVNQRLEEKNLALEVTKSKVESVLYASMDPHVAKLIIDRRLRNEKRSLSVLFADLAEFTRSTEERPPESVIEDLNRLFSEMEPAIARFRGHVDKYLGDGLMVEFGVPLPTENHSLYAVMAAVAMQKRMSERRFPWKMRIGVATGHSLVGLVGSDSRKNYTAIGDAVNMASRLQSLCPQGAVCIDEATHEAVKRFFRTRRVRDGMSTVESSQLEARLELVADMMSGAPTAKGALEAADLASRLGDMSAALKWHRRALELDPSLRQPIERAISAALLTGPERDVQVKGKRDRQAVFEVLGLRDPVEDLQRVPPAAVEVFRKYSKELWLAEEHVLAVEIGAGSVGHGPVTAALCGALGAAAGLDDRACKEVFISGYLHDIGKKNIPDFLRAREDRFDELPPVDQEMLRGHVLEAEKVIAEWGLPRSPDVIEAISQHHERLDGSGYPRGLSGDKVSLLGRIVAIADSYEDLTGWHFRREPLTARAALAELRREAELGKIDGPLLERFAGILAPLL
ncbi:MAG: HD domain-containing protein [Elusimicrobia bacterium]|nr:HD domain-containing protein [Elusimicrobiota bacterium]